MINPEQREFYPLASFGEPRLGLKETNPNFSFSDLEVLKPFLPKPDLLNEFPSLDEEKLTEYKESLDRLLKEPDLTRKLEMIALFQRGLAANEKTWQKEKEEREQEIRDRRKEIASLSETIQTTERILKDRKKEQKKEWAEGRIRDALSWTLVALTKRWQLTKPTLRALGLVALHPTRQEILPYKMRPLFEEFEMANQQLEELEKTRSESQREYQQQMLGLERQKEKLEKPLAEKLTDWVVENRNRVIILILNDPDNIEKWTSAYLKRAAKKPTQEEVLAYLIWALQTYKTHQEQAVNKNRFRQWVSFCFEKKSPEEVGELFSAGKSQDFEKELARSFDHFAQSLKHLHLRENFSQFLRWWLNLELKFYELPIKEKRKPRPYFILKEPRRKLREKPKRKEIPKSPEVVEAPVSIFIANQEKPVTLKELEEYLMEVLADHLGPENIPSFLGRIKQTLLYIKEGHHPPGFESLKGDTQEKLGAEWRARWWGRWRFLVNLDYQNSTAILELVGALPRDQKYRTGMINFYVKFLIRIS